MFHEGLKWKTYSMAKRGLFLKLLLFDDFFRRTRKLKTRPDFREVKFATKKMAPVTLVDKLRP